MKYFIFLVMLLMAVMASGQQCYALLDIPGIQVGVVKIKELNTKDNQQDTGSIQFSQYSLTLQQPLPNSKVILSLSQINAETSTLDLFDININSMTDSEIQLTFVYQNSKWNEVSYRYLITNKTQELYLQMITLTSKQISLYKTDNSIQGNNIMIGSAFLDRALTEPIQKYKVLGFIRGLKYKNDLMKDHSLSIAISNFTLTQQTVDFFISSLPNQEGVQMQLLSVSIVYFNPQKLTFVPFGGLVTRTNFINKTRDDILDLDLPGKLYEFYGISFINLEKTFSGYILQSDIDKDFIFDLETSKTFKNIDFTYFVIGLNPGSVCSLCENQKYLSGQECVTKCNADQIVYQFRNSSQLACIKPKVEQESNNSINNQVVSSHSSASSTSTDNDQPSFKQVVGFATDFQNHKQSAQSNQQGSSQQNISQSNYTDHFNYCNTIENSYWSGESCHCRVGFVMKRGKCQLINQSSQGNQSNPQKLDNTEKMVFVNESSGQSNSANISAINSSPNQTENQQSVNSNKPTCPTNLQTFDESTKKCTCNNGLNYMEDPSTKDLACVKCNNFEGTFSQNGWCKYCGQNKIYDNLLKKCKCKDGFSQKESGQCFQNVQKNASQVVQENNQQKSQVDEHQNGSDTNLKQVTNTSNNIKQESVNNQTASSLNSPVADNGQSLTQNTTKIQVNESLQQNQDSTIFNQQTVQIISNNQQFNQGSDIPEIKSHIVSPLDLTNSSSYSNTVSQTTTNNDSNNNNINNMNSNTSNKNNADLTATNIPTASVEKTDKKVDQNFTSNHNPNQNLSLNISENNVNASQSSSDANKTLKNTQNNVSQQSVSSSISLSEANKTLIPNQQTVKPISTSIVNNTVVTPQINCMILVSTPKLNTANLFITLQLSTQITFKTQDQMRNFLQYQFNPQIYEPGSIYCNQNQENKKTFECLLLYPSGIPNEKFQINFSYTQPSNGELCSLNVPIDPLESAAKSLRLSKTRV